MKKIILILVLLNGFASAQIVGGPITPLSTSTLSNKTLVSPTITGSPNLKGAMTGTGSINITGAITTPTVYGGSTAGSTLNLMGSSSATPGVVSVGSSTASSFVARGTMSVSSTSTLADTWVQGATPMLSVLSTSSGAKSAKVGMIATGGVNYPGIWFSQSAPDVTNYSFLYDGGNLATIIGAPASGAVQFRVNNSTYLAVTANSVAVTGSISVSGNVSTKHIIGNSTAPTIVRGTGLGTGAGTVVSVTNATDLSGIIGVVTGTASLGTSAVLATLTFNAAYGAAPNIVLTPANLAAANLVIGSNCFPSSSTTTLNVNTNTVALTASTTYSWYYTVHQ